MSTLNRRRFLRVAGITLGACALTCAGSGLLLSGEDQPREVLPVGFPDSRYGEETASKKILVAYASAAGSTGGVAEAIGKALAFGSPGEWSGPAVPAPAAVEVRPVLSVSDLKDYSAVIVGSAVHGKWLPEATEFVRANRDRLRQVPTAFFLVGMMVASSSPANRSLVAQYLLNERELVTPVAEGHFVGALHPSQYPFPTGFGMRFFLAYCGLGLRGGDYRDPGAISAWAKSIRPLLLL